MLTLKTQRNKEALMSAIRIPKSAYLLLPALSLVALAMSANQGCADATPVILMTVTSVAEGDASAATQIDGTTINDCASACEFSIDSSAPPNTRGKVELTQLEKVGQYPMVQPGQYTLPIFMVNSLNNNANIDGSGQRANTNDIIITEVRIRWVLPDGTLVYEPGDGDEPGARALALELQAGGEGKFAFVNLVDSAIIPDDSAPSSGEIAYLRGALFGPDGAYAGLGNIPHLVYVELQAIGQTFDGTRTIESEVIEYPVDICDSCSQINIRHSYCCSPGLDPDIDPADYPDGNVPCPQLGANPICIPSG